MIMLAVYLNKKSMTQCHQVIDFIYKKIFKKRSKNHEYRPIESGNVGDI